MPTCNCEKWKANMNKLDAPLVLAQIRNPSYRYDGEPFSFCPWCGSGLTAKPVIPEGCCELCGEPMPPGETMFKFHGYSGPCPKPPVGFGASARGDGNG